MTESNVDQSNRVKKYLTGLTSGGEEELLESTVPEFSSIAESIGATPEEIEVLTSAGEKLRLGEDLNSTESLYLEAIILPDKRPVIDVIADDYHTPAQHAWKFLAESNYKKRFKKILPAVGRVELVAADSGPPYIGSGFMIAKDMMLTNRHVAQAFVSGLGEKVTFISGLEGQIDLENWILPSGGLILKIVKPLMIHPWYDAAILKVEGFPSDREPLTLLAERPEDLMGTNVVAIGYPAFDPRNSIDVQNRVFRGIFNVKRMMPGKLSELIKIKSFKNNVTALGNDYSSLGGVSGAPVVDAETGNVLGLHFGGRYLESNYAVPTWELLTDEHVQKLNPNISGNPGEAVTWIDKWAHLESTATSVPVPTRVTDDENESETEHSYWQWFESSTETELVEEFRANPELTAEKLRATLNDDEAEELMADLAAFGDGDEEGLFYPEPDPDLPEIFLIHGIMGSHLANRGFFKNRYWLDPKEIAKGNLAERLALQPDGVSDRKGLNIESDGHIKLAYGKAVRRLRKQRFVVHDVHYDWRKSLETAAAGLNELIENRASKNNGKPAVIVAHSMGGLVASTYSMRFPNWQKRIESAMFFGSPLGGSYAVPIAVLGYHDLLNKLAFVTRSNNKMDFRKMAASLPGLIEMLPNPDLFSDAADFYTQQGWPAGVIPSQRFLSKSLNLKKELREAPILSRTSLLIALEHGTINEMPWTEDRSNRVLGRRDGIGDGTVPAVSAYVPGVPAFMLNNEHGSLLKEDKAIQAISSKILQGSIELASVEESDLNGRNQIVEALEESIDDWETRRSRFVNGVFTQKDYEWLGDF